MFKQILTTVCTAALLSAGSVAMSDRIDNSTNIEQQVMSRSLKVSVGAPQYNDQNQGSLSNQSNVR